MLDVRVLDWMWYCLNFLGVENGGLVIMKVVMVVFFGYVYEVVEVGFGF